jgi:hypothetical protein
LINARSRGAIGRRGIKTTAGDHEDDRASTLRVTNARSRSQVLLSAPGIGAS